MTHIPDRRWTLLSIVMMTAAAFTPAFADDPPSLGEAVTKGKISLNLRYRYEDVEQTGFVEPGKASTLRTSLGYRTLWWNRLSAMLEFENVVNVGFSNDHNNGGFGSLWNGVTDRPAIPDPPLTEINQVSLDWKPMDSLSIRGGRQEIIIDNARLIGNVGWRQNHQSFDGATARFTGVKKLDLSYAYIARQRTVSGASNPMSTSHLEGAYTFTGVGSLHGYLLSVDFDHESLWLKSTTTYGAFFEGKSDLAENLGLTYRLEFATQQEAGKNPESIEADYLRADLGLIFGRVTAAAGYEVLGGADGDGAFNTPLATLHKFNGWADKFLTTPTDGLTDFFVILGANVGRFALLGVYHDFSADSGGADWGSEFDASVVYTAPWKQKFAIEAAFYDAGDWATDTDKIWLWTQWGF